MLFTALSVAIIMAVFSAFNVAHEAREAFFAPTPLFINGETIPSAVTIAFTIRDVIVLALSVACLLLYMRFCLDAIGTQSLFTHKQCQRLLSTGLLLLAASGVSGAFGCVYSTQIPSGVDITAIGIFGFNAWTLVLALFALSLSAIFEYGRLLQSDVDAII